MSQEELFLDSTHAGHCKSGTGDSRSRSRLGLLATGVVGGSLVALYAVAAPFVAPALRKVCLPFVPATTAQVENVLTVLRARSGTLVDIGSGDGRIVIAAAKRGFQASGFELNPWLVWYSRYKAWREGVHRCTSFHISDLWKILHQIGLEVSVYCHVQDLSPLCPVTQFCQKTNSRSVLPSTPMLSFLGSPR
ncbi:ATP synthase subunit C lysine N-methyltransferase isoform X2 [Anabas testudineus]|uniref:ATP synthase subunit C lysine N-methyltransferase isoform X2 n=1 Tax=Anabas testudineus TaxID=64144 RepID=UPI000E463E9D|nr:ATP synthase subunit C lysine N-methyltransferase isoform X2 [Anabas testudineus]